MMNCQEPDQSSLGGSRCRRRLGLAGESAPVRADDPTQPAPLQQVKTLGPHLWPTSEWRPTMPDLHKRRPFRAGVTSDTERTLDLIRL
jgi:hypothetical protein